MEAIPFTEFLTTEVVTFVLVVTRVSGILMFGPALSSNSLPSNFRFYLAFAIAILVTSVVPAPAVDQGTVIDMVLMLFGELLIGWVFGSFLMMMLQALQLAGQVAGTQMGLALANVINPQLDEQTSSTASAYLTVAILIFLGSGADREMIGALLESFEVVPLGQVWLHDSLRELVMLLFAESMIFAVRVSAPVTVVMLLTEVSMGFAGRTVPQLNILSIGFGLRILLGLWMTMITMRTIGYVFEDQMSVAFQYGYQAIANLIPESVLPE